MKRVLPIIIAFIIISGGAFYGGMKYAQSKTLPRFSQGEFQELRNLSPEERQQRLVQIGASAGEALGGKRFMRQEGEEIIGGEIIAKDDKSITVKLRDGGSNIVFFSESTDITKSVSGFSDDLQGGKQVRIDGTKNPDGSYTAKTIQLETVSGF